MGCKRMSSFSKGTARQRTYQVVEVSTHVGQALQQHDSTGSGPVCGRGKKLVDALDDGVLTKEDLIAYTGCAVGNNCEQGQKEFR